MEYLRSRHHVCDEGGSGGRAEQMLPVRSQLGVCGRAGTVKQA